ncbi:MAG TPA: glycoside hydrolase family 140 protein [Mucilaginibacter sp.]|jgi:hypothetical protein
MKTLFILLFFLTGFLSSNAQSPFSHGQIVLASNGHYLQHEDGTPFFWLGDTAWELFHRLKMEEIDRYLNNRHDKGFNVIQAVILAEFDGLTKPNVYGDVPLNNLNPETPNEYYFKFVDSVVKLAQSKGLYIGLLPTWGDKVTKAWGTGPVVFNVENAYRYGYWIGNRYKNYPNIIWILGGDRPAKNDTADWRPIWRAMAKGITDVSGKKPFITYHPSGGPNSTSQYIHHEPWLTMNMIQSGHGNGHDVAIWDLITRDFNLSPRKPVLDAEPNYEDHPVNPWPKWDPASGYYRAYDVRKQLYRSVFSGGCGVTYGHHSVWQFYSAEREKINYADRYWTEAIDRPGAFQAGYLKKLITSRPSLNRIPDSRIITDGQGLSGKHSCAFADSSGSYLMIYIPLGKQLTVNTGRLRSANLVAWWYNPKNGKVTKIGSLKREGSMSFTPPTTGFENDWVLVLDDPKYKYAIPGS